jgi:hypothetical protein
MMFYLYYVDLYNNMSMDEYHDVLPLLCRSLQQYDIVKVKHHGTHPLTYCCKDIHSKGKTSWYSSIDILL